MCSKSEGTSDTKAKASLFVNYPLVHPFSSPETSHSLGKTASVASIEKSDLICTSRFELLFKIRDQKIWQHWAHSSSHQQLGGNEAQLFLLKATFPPTSRSQWYLPYSQHRGLGGIGPPHKNCWFIHASCLGLDSDSWPGKSCASGLNPST